MSTTTKRNDGLITIKVPCMRCEKPVAVDVDPNYKRKIRKFCPLCRANVDRTDTVFDDSYTNGCRRVSKGR